MSLDLTDVFDEILIKTLLLLFLSDITMPKSALCRDVHGELLKNRILEIRGWLKNQFIVYRDCCDVAAAINAKYAEKQQCTKVSEIFLKLNERKTKTSCFYSMIFFFITKQLSRTSKSSCFGCFFFHLSFYIKLFIFIFIRKLSSRFLKFHVILMIAMYKDEFRICMRKVALKSEAI